MKQILSVVALLVFSVPVSGAELSDASVATKSESVLAQKILLTMMSESESVRSEAAAHELLGDAYACDGLRTQAQCEYAIARQITLNQAAKNGAVSSGVVTSCQ